MQEKAFRERDPALLVEALNVIQGTLDQISAESSAYAVALSNYGWLLTSYHDATADPAALDEAVRALEFALEAMAPAYPARINTVNNLVPALADRATAADLDRALQLVRAAVGSLPDLPAAIALTTRATFARVAMVADDPGLAVVVHERALAMRDQLYRTMPGRWVVRLSPHEHDRTAQLLVRGVEEGGVVGFAELFLLALAAVVSDRPVDQPRAVAGFDADQSGDRDPARSLADTVTIGVWPRRDQVRAFGGLSD